MKNSHVLAVVVSAALTPLIGCSPSKRAEFRELAPQKAEELAKAAEQSPLTITVTIDKEHNVFLKDERAGTTTDVTPLKEKLAPALEKRKEAYRASVKEGTSSTEEASRGEKVVFVRAPSSFKYGEVVKVVEAIKAVGGEPIGVQDSGANR
jgi:biopolymer transport protein ExbD